MKYLSFILSVIFLPSLSFGADGIIALQKMGKKDVMEWKKYQFKRSFKDSGEVTIQIFFDGKKIEEHTGYSNGSGRDFDRNWTYLNLYQLLPGPDVQAVVYCSGGGKDHDGGYSILNLNENGDLKELFDSDKYLLVGYFDFSKCSKSKFPILKDEAEPWMDFSFISTEEPRVSEAFEYDETKKQYVPFPCDSFLDENAEGNAMYDESMVALLLNLVSIDWFSGKTKQGWDFFNKHYSGRDKKELTLKIKEVMKKDPYLKEIKSN